MFPQDKGLMTLKWKYQFLQQYIFLWGLSNAALIKNTENNFNL